LVMLASIIFAVGLVAPWVVLALLTRDRRVR
jgi:hypothetical protein